MRIWSPARLSLIVGILSAAINPTFLSSTTFLGNWAGPVQAQENADGAKVRLELTDRLRTFSQRVAAATCNFLHVTSDPRRETLEEIHQAFGRDLIILRDGDPSIGVLTATHDHRVAGALQQVEEIWTGMDAALMGVLESGSAEQAEIIFESNIKLLDAVNILMSEEERAYANPQEMTFGEAMILDLAGRQRMLTQSIAKDVCLISIGKDVAEYRTALTASEEMFSNSLDALSNGLPAMGIKPPTDPHVVEALERTQEDWLEAKEIIDRAALDHTPSIEEVIAVREATERLLADSSLIEEILAGETEG